MPDSQSCKVPEEDRKECKLVAGIPELRKVFESESGKVQNEISERSEHIDEWFKYKFAVVGILIGTFFNHVAKKPIAKRGGLEGLLKSSLSCIVIAVTCTIAIGVDIHIRNDIMAIQQLGSWLAYHAEPHMSGFHFDEAGPLFWEKFIRQLGGMHADALYRYTFFPHLHFLTWVMYVLYLWLFQGMCLKYKKSEKEKSHNANKIDGKSECWIIFATFCLVHCSLLALTFMATQSPSQFEFQLIPSIDRWIEPLQMFLLYALVLFALITINAQYIVVLISTCNKCLSWNQKKT